MNEQQTSGQAFPTMERGGGGLDLADPGMTLRDYFAAKAMQALINPKGEDFDRIDEVPEYAYEIADAMLAARALPKRAPEMSGKHMGFMYIGTAPCGCTTGMSWDDEDAKKSNALFVAKMIRRGDAVARIERFEGDSVPTHECEKHASERAARKVAKTQGAHHEK